MQTKGQTNNKHGSVKFMKVTKSKIFLTLSAFLLLSFANIGHAEKLNAYVDKNVVQLGQFIQFSITLSNKSASNDPDFSVLQQDFDILNNPSRSSQTQYVNGKMSSSTTWSVTIAPKRDGALVIPPIKLAGLSTEPITVVVGKAPERKYSDAYFETEVSTKEVYVQSQLKLDLKLYIRMADLSNSKLEEIDVSNAKVVKVGDAQQSEIVKNGIRYYLIEKSYFIFPEKSGALDIPSITFTAVVNEGSRFSRFGNRRKISASSDFLRLSVKGIPDIYPKDAVWLPAEELVLQESFSPGVFANVGEPLTRNIITQAKGLPASALPPIELEDIDELKNYPDQGSTDEQITQSHLIGMRSDSFALIAKKEGTITLPTYQLPWWDTKTNTLRYAQIDGKTLSFAKGSLSQEADSNQNLRISRESLETEEQDKKQWFSLDNNELLIIVGLFLTVWLITIFVFLYYIHNLKKNNITEGNVSDDFLRASDSEKEALNKLKNAINESNAAHFRSLLLEWANIYFAPELINGLAELSKRMPQFELEETLKLIDDSLYGDSSKSADKQSLEKIYKSIKDFSEDKKAREKKAEKGKPLADLYKS
jgi:hypothetical protein